MRKLLLGAFCAAIAFGFASSANATSVCHGPLQASGQKFASERMARASARGYWQKAAARKHGPAFADWYYAGEREEFCNWDKSGRYFWCSTRGRPCA